MIYNEDCNIGLDRIPDESIDLVMMDPPYDIQPHHGGGAFGPANRTYYQEIAPISDGIDMMLFDKIMKKCKRINAYVWCSKAQLLDFINWFASRDCTWDILTWHKTNPTPLNNNHYLHDTEYVVFGRDKGVPLYGDYHSKRRWYESPVNIEDKNVWGHPTIKPLPFVQTLIENSTQPGDTVLDPFMGSGTTAVACVRSKRKYVGFEIDETYYKTCVRRVQSAHSTTGLDRWVEE